MFLQDTDQLLVRRVCIDCARKGCDICNNTGYIEIPLLLKDFYNLICERLEYRYDLTYNQAFLRDTI